MMKDRKALEVHVALVAIGAPLLFSGRPVAASIGASRDLYELAVPAVSDDARRGRLVALSVVVDGTWLRQLLAAARGAGWAG